MSLTIDLSPDLESRVEREARLAGTDPAGFVVQALETLLPAGTPEGSLRASESELLLQINEGLPSESWDRFHGLTTKRRAGSLTPEEHAALLRITEDIERLGVRQLDCLAELARIRGTTVRELMKALGISPPPYE